MTTQTIGQENLAQNPETPPNAPTDPAAAPPAAEPEAAPVEIDIDAIELAAAQKALEDEKAGIKPEPAPAIATPAAAPAAAAQPAAEKVMIPKERLDEVLAREGETAKERDDAIASAAYWRGIADAKGHGGQPAAQPQPQPQATAKAQIESLEGKLLEAAKRFDSGDISLVDYEKERLAINSQIQGIREARLYAATRPQPGTQTATPQDMRLDELTAQLEQANPYVGELSKPEYDGKWAFLSKEAADQLGPDWKNQPPSASKSFELRKKIAELSNVYGPIWTGKTLQAAAAPGTPSPAKPALSAPAQNRLAKLTLAQAQPPDANTIGTPAATAVTISDAQIAEMSDEQISALPAATRERLFPSLNG